MTATQLTGLSKSQYSKIRITYFVKYCAIHASNEMHMQEMLINRKLFTWYNRQVIIAENNFINLMAHQTMMKQSVAIDMLHGQLHGIFSKYNKHMIKPLTKKNQSLTLLN